MPYITSVERIGIEKGIRKGLIEGIPIALEIKFGAEGLEILPEISQIKDVDVLRAVLNGIKIKNTLEELRKIYL
ncbi:MAG: hypothetical protein QNJ49_10940 [Mastigocoleus sp. MO_167.B18]|nr:hypothetical protein [Mastigocoleus sp. MO_167.B18]